MLLLDAHWQDEWLAEKQKVWAARATERLQADRAEAKGTPVR